MERDYYNPLRQESRIVINDYPSSHLPPQQRPKFWGDTSQPQRELSYVERPCIPRETAASDRVEQLQRQDEKAQLQPSDGDYKCRQETGGSGVCSAHCSPCYVSSALYAGDRSNRSSAQAPDTAAEVTQLSDWVTKQLEKAAMSGCGSTVKPTKRVT